MLINLEQGDPIEETRRHKNRRIVPAHKKPRRPYVERMEDFQKYTEKKIEGLTNRCMYLEYQVALYKRILVENGKEHTSALQVILIQD